MSNLTQNKFYHHVSTWIGSINRKEQVQGVRNFLCTSKQPEEVRQALHEQLDKTLARLDNTLTAHYLFITPNNQLS